MCHELYFCRENLLNKAAIVENVAPEVLLYPRQKAASVPPTESTAPFLFFNVSIAPPLINLFFLGLLSFQVHFTSNQN